jgi:hypothetical protein
MADDGRPAPIPIDLERAADGAYAFRLGVRAGFGGQQTARIPIEWRVNPAPHPILKEIHSCEVGGRALEAANVYALRAKVAAQLEAIAPGRSLPLCYFRAPAMDYELPVYEDGGRLHAPVIGGPRLRAGDLAGIRRHVCRYLVNAGYVREPDEVIVGVLRPRDLRRVAPAAIFRDLHDHDVWLPSVEGVSAEGPVVGVLGRAARLQVEERPRAGAGPAAAQSAPAATDVIELLRFLRTAGMGGALYATEVRAEIWAAALATTADTRRRLVAYLTDDDATELELEIRRAAFGEVVVALEDRGITVFLARDEDDLAQLAGEYLAAAGFLRFAAEVELHDAPSERAERLDVEAISSLEPEEVRQA